MNEKTAYWASVVLSTLALVLMIASVFLINGNRDLQAEVAQRQAIINSGINLSQLNQSLVQALADASIKDDDKQIRDLLAAQGITIKPPAQNKPDVKKK